MGVKTHSIGEVRYHKGRDLFYIYEFYPGKRKETLKWVRLDSFIRGKLMHTRLRTVAPSSLTRLRRSVQKKVIRALALLPERP
jgi:hypothetical protein